MKKSFNRLDVLFMLASLVHIILGIVVICFCGEEFEKNNYFVGGVLTVSALPSLLIFLSSNGFKHFRKVPYLVSSVIALVIGIVFVCCEELTPAHLFLFVGIFDICRGIFESIDAALEFKENKLEIIEIFAGLGDVLFGILLCIKLENGYKNHLIFMGVALILVGIKFAVDLILDLKRPQ